MIPPGIGEGAVTLAVTLGIAVVAVGAVLMILFVLGVALMAEMR